MLVSGRRPGTVQRFVVEGCLFGYTMARSFTIRY
jgi:hypothetical protein